MKQTPAGWPRISSSLFYDDAAAAIDWLCRVFGFEVRLKVEGEGGRIEHSELTFGEGLIMIGSSGQADEEKKWRINTASPQRVNGVNTQALCVFVDDVDAHCARAKAAGATILNEPKTTDYGEEYWTDRTYLARDLEGHQWWFMQRLRG
jgi:uncharacterized glyoxalase superfamily protein PhnB